MSTETYPPLTAEEFNNGCGYTCNGVPLVENEDGLAVFAYGHIDPPTFAKAVTDYDREMAGDDVEATHPLFVRHRWAVTTEPADGPDGWFIRSSGVTAETPGAFPLTVVDR